jgi:hypothetical protein
MANQNEKDRRKTFLNRKSRNSICSRFNARTPCICRDGGVMLKL